MALSVVQAINYNVIGGEESITTLKLLGGIMYSLFRYLLALKKSHLNAVSINLDSFMSKFYDRFLKWSVYIVRNLKYLKFKSGF